MMKIIVVILSAVLLIQGQVSNLNLRLISNVRPITEAKSTAIFFNSKGENVCSGALIHSLWILTTAECANKLYDEERRVKIGGNVVINFNDASYIKNVFVHPNFNDELLENDIALVELVKPTDTLNRVWKISSEWIKAGQKAYSLGYGDNGNVAGKGILRQQNITIIDSKICAKYSAINVDFNRLCSFQSIACEGDQGGPLISSSNNQLIGLISINQDQAVMCGTEISPFTTFVRISGYVHWIRIITNIVYL